MKSFVQTNKFKSNMAANRNSEDVVMPDISEAEQLRANDHDGERSNSVASAVAVLASKPQRGNATNNLVTVPVSLPVGTLISSGSTFNVITSENLSQFKPMLCVDNGFISSNSSQINDDIKPTHIVIQNPVSPPSQRDESGSRESLPSWDETANMAILPVRCKNVPAELHKNKFGSGGRGRCIKMGHRWYTPSEFEAVCGRASSKDWKRSIKFGGRSIQILIDEGILTPHAISCTCGACCDDQNAMGPIRLFTPYKRRRKTYAEELERASRMKNDSESDENQTSNCHSEEAWHSLSEGLENTSEFHLLNNQQTNISNSMPDAKSVLKKLDDIGTQLNKLVSDYKQCVEEVKQIHSRQQEQLEQQHASALITANADVSDQRILLSMDDNESKKCANCNREASAECSLCRKTPYCSTYCQKKDWGAHQIECLRGVPPIENSDGQAHQSIMLIVENHQ